MQHLDAGLATHHDPRASDLACTRGGRVWIKSSAKRIAVAVQIGRARAIVALLDPRLWTLLAISSGLLRDHGALHHVSAVAVLGACTPCRPSAEDAILRRAIIRAFPSLVHTRLAVTRGRLRDVRVPSLGTVPTVRGAGPPL